MGRTVFVKTGPGHRSKNTKVIAKKALSLARSNVGEMKAKDRTPLAGVTMANNFVVDRLAIPTTGDDGDDRDGDRIQPKSLHLYGNVLQNSSATDTFIRLIVLKDKQCNGIAPVVTEVMVTDDIHSLVRFTTGFRKRFQILSDRRYNLSATDHERALINTKIKLSGYMLFLGSTDAVTSAGRNTLWLLSIANEATNLPTILVHDRMEFRDA